MVEVRAEAADAARRLRGMAAQVVDLRPFWPVVRRIFGEHMSEQFSSEGSWGGKPWAPLARTRGRGGGILVDTGFMRSRVAGRAGPRAVARPRSLTLTIDDRGTDRPKGTAGYHQSGTSRMVARPIIPTPYPAQGVREYQDAADEWAAGIVRAWGFGG